MMIKLLFDMFAISDTVLNGYVLLYLLRLHFICVTAVNKQKWKSKLWSPPRAYPVSSTVK